MCALIDNLHHGLDIWTVHHGLEDIDVLAAMVHLVVGLSTSPHTCWRVGRVRSGWEGGKGQKGGWLNIQSPNILYCKAPTDNTKLQHAGNTKTPTDNAKPQHTIHKPDGEERGRGREGWQCHIYIYILYIYAIFHLPLSIELSHLRLQLAGRIGLRFL